MNSATATNVLLLIITALIFERVQPAWAPLVWLVVGGLVAVWGISWFKRRRERRRVVDEQNFRDEQEFKEYWAEHQAIRAKYDPEHKWNEATRTPREYREEIDLLNAQHRDMLKRRFGEDY
jgi:Mg2+/citrate symporter